MLVVAYVRPTLRQPSLHGVRFLHIVGAKFFDSNMHEGMLRFYNLPFWDVKRAYDQHATLWMNIVVFRSLSDNVEHSVTRGAMNNVSELFMV